LLGYELVGGVEALYASLEAYLLRCEHAREKLAIDLAKVQKGINARQLQADEHQEAFEHESHGQYDQILEKFGRELGLDSSRDQYSHACGEGLAACEVCSATWEGDARTYLDDFQQRSVKTGVETAFKDDGFYAGHTELCHGCAGTGIFSL
jgi:hypothetical protein